MASGRRIWRRRARRGLLDRIVARALHASAALGLGLLVALVCLGALAALRLSAGPVPLPLLAGLAERALGARLAGLDLGIGDVEFALGDEAGDPAGLRIRDVTLRDATGRLVLSARSVGARFHLGEALRGALAPTEIVLSGTRARILREPDGRFRLAFAPPGGEEVEADPAATASALLAAMMAGELPALARLERVRLARTAITYEDRMSGRTWRTEDGEVVLERRGDRIEGTLRVALRQGGGLPTRLAVTAARMDGDGTFAVTLGFENAWTADLADQIPALGWMRPVVAPLAGTVSLELEPGGRLRYLTARITAGQGLLRPDEGTGIALAGGALDFAYDGRTGLFAMERLAFDTGPARLVASGEARTLLEEGRIAGFAADLVLRDIVAAPEGLFAAPVAFERGRLRGRMALDPFRLEIDEAELRGEADRILFRGRIARAAAGWTGEATAEAEGIDTRRLVALWPLRAAPGARAWVDRAMPEGVIDRLEARLALAEGRPEAVVTFAFREAVAFPVPGLPPIRHADGTGRLDMTSFAIALETGIVTPEGRGAIDLTGSTFRIPDLHVFPTRGLADLRGRGTIPDILALIDHPPLGLLERIGVTPDLATGRAEVAATLDMPLLRALTPAEVGVTAEAVLSDLRLADPVNGLAVSAERLDLAATGRELRIEGPARLGPAAARVEWTETFRPGPGEPRSRIAARLGLTPALFRALGAEALAAVLTGEAPARLAAERPAEGPPVFTLTADLGPAGLALPGLGWSKPPGAPGSLRLAGRLGAEILLRDLRLEAGELALAGTARLDAAGRLLAADLARFRLGQAIDSRLVVTMAEGTPRLALRGGRLDLLALGRLLPAAAPEPRAARPEVTLDLERIELAGSLALVPGTGRLGPAAPGEPFLVLAGRANGGAETEIAVSEAGAELALRLEAADAGAFLRDSGYFRGGHGGRLRLDLRLVPGRPGMTGRLAIDRILVREAPVLMRLLSVASITGVLERMASGGLTFDRVEAPFELRDGRITLAGGRATGGSIGLTFEGEYDEARDRLDLAGVFSPAYLLNGLLGEVPLVGDLLTGRQGEGVFGFAYRVRGSAVDPSVTVNPLSILTPGALRGMFTRESRRPPGPARETLPAEAAPAEAAPAEALVPAPPPAATLARPTRQERQDLVDR